MASSKNGKGRMMTVVVLLVLAGFLLFAFYNVHRSRQEKPQTAAVAAPIPVSTIRAARGPLDWVVATSGDLQSLEDVYVFPKFSGKMIEKILVEKGDRVKRGQLLVILDEEMVNAQVKRAVAAVDVAASQVAMLEKDYQRLAFLYEHKAAPKQQLDRVEAQHDAAQAGLREARAALDELTIVAGDHRIRAAIDGLVADRYVDAGNLADRTKPLLRLANDTTLKVKIAVPEIDYPHVRLGMSGEFSVDAYPRRRFNGTVATITPTLDPATRTAGVELQLPNDNLELRAGMFAHVILRLGRKEALLIPRDTLNRLPGSGSYYVFVVEEGKARLRNISVGLKQGNRVAVTAGLEDGELVVIKGQNRLQDGAAVNLVETLAVEDVRQ
ncbi:MAG: efflux RND transporter periplasmic adaptor subunit [Deltaproteobacteria bacterium]|nr:efflux RND transporter periplasmic adaptor subunit [Candidatus Anaeroferrophillus wilburensis]MBN2887985.1 efflux RND transporter periplasmic adaptor subunit [Deltaproteobacteria bacterium]